MNEERPEEVSTPPEGRSRWPVAAAIAFFIISVACGFYIAGLRRQAAQLTAGYDQMSVALNQARNQLDTVTAKLNSLSALPPPEPAPSVAPAEAPRVHSVVAKRARAKRAAADDPRWKQIQAELSEHQKQIDATRQDVKKTRSNLEGKLDTTRDELNGSIARNHEELVVLQKKGLRNYFEFNLSKSKLFHRAGPISVSLRKTNTKHGYCDLKMIVDDAEIEKKHANLYEPVQFYPSDYAQPLELVINQVEKDEAHGYVSVPKFRQSELTASTAGQTTNQEQPPASSAASQQPPAPSTASLDHREPPTQ